MHPDKAKQAFIASRAKPPAKKTGDKGKKPGVHVTRAPTEKEIQNAIKKATVRIARLSGVAEILKGEGRERYDYFLANGFPRWRGTGYYYARFRPGLGSVLVGLFVVGGGFAHYGALYLSWRRQKEFVQRYIRHARKAAWGDDSGIGGIPGVDGVAATPPTLPAEDDAGITLNRRQKRQQERENKKDGSRSKGVRQGGTSTPMDTDSVTEPQGAKKRVQAENGKTLVVDSAGNVFLEGEDEDGERQEYLLDPAEISKPTISQTLVLRLPIWAYVKVRCLVTGLPREVEEEVMMRRDLNGVVNGKDAIENAKKSSHVGARKRGRRGGKAN